MDTKLTLKLNKAVIERAKAYAATQNRSLSKMIEAYLKSITSELPENPPDQTVEITDFVRNMRTGVKLPLDLDYKDTYKNHLAKKYK